MKYWYKIWWPYPWGGFEINIGFFLSFWSFFCLFCQFLEHFIICFAHFCPSFAQFCPFFCYFLSICCPIYPAFAFFVHPTLLKFMSPRAASYHNLKNIFFLIIYIKLTIHIVEFYYLEIIFRYLTPLLPNMVNKASKWNWTPTPSNLAYIIL